VLLSFRVSNHKSIRDEQTLHMQPVFDKGRPALPVAAIFGANAAGKSNLLDALSFMVHAVRDSFGRWDREEGVPRRPFRLDQEFAATPSRFAVELMLEGVRYNYGFAIDDDRVHEEWLHSYPVRRRRVIFERNDSGVRVPAADSRHRGMAEFIIEAMPGALLLSMATLLRIRDVGPIHKWFLDGIAFVDPARAQFDEAALITEVAQTDRSYARRFVDLVRAADVDIKGIEANVALGIGGESVTLDANAVDELAKVLGRNPSDAPDNSADLSDMEAELRLIFHQGRHKTRMSLSEQSHGTRVWLSYLLPILRALDTGLLLVVDEIDTSLHPHLTAQLIALFRSSDTNPRSAQLVFTTHDAALLGRVHGEDVLGRDEVWFVEKDRDGATSLYALADFKPRKEESTERRYLTGSYGAVPMLFEGDFKDAVEANHQAGGRAAS